MENLDVDRDQELIIPRALFMTTERSFEADIKRLEGIYTHAEIVNNLQRTTERLSGRIIDMVARRYHVAIFGRTTYR